MITLDGSHPAPRKRPLSVGRLFGRLSRLFAGEAPSPVVPDRVPRRGRWWIEGMVVDVRILGARISGRVLEYRIRPVAGSGGMWIRADYIEARPIEARSDAWLSGEA